MMGDAEDEPDHPAALAGCKVWLECKHCDAWVEDADDDEEDDDG